MKRCKLYIALLTFVALLFSWAFPAFAEVTGMANEMLYQQALQDLDLGRYDEAINQFGSLNMYEKSKAYHTFAWAMKYLEMENFSSAIQYFEILSNISFTDDDKHLKDSKDFLQYARGRKAEAAGDIFGAKEYYKGLTILDSIDRLLNLAQSSPTPTPSPTITVGETIELGGYAWRVLEVRDGMALILSDRILESRLYHRTNTNITWEKCSLREYLNGEFYNHTFSAEEKALIAETDVVNDNNPWYDTNGGAKTKDKVFLLSIAEVIKYFGDSGDLGNRKNDQYYIDDQYNAARKALNASGKASMWWLRSSGRGAYRAAYIYDSGYVRIQGRTVNRESFGVRPCLWLKL